MKFIRRLAILIFAALFGTFFYYRYSAIATIATNLHKSGALNSGGDYSGGNYSGGSGGVGRVGGVGSVGSSPSSKIKFGSD